MNSNSNPESSFDSHEPLVDRALMGLDLAAEHHLSNCSCCRGEREKTEQALKSYAALEREQASRPESFWSDQATRVRAVQASVKRHPWAAAVLIPALGLLLVLGIEFAPRREPPRPAAAARVETISDHDLLVAVERAVDNGTPYAFAPVALVVDEAESSAVMPNKNVPQKYHKKMMKELNSHAQ